MMKAVCVIGSPKSNGTTACIVDTVIDGMKASNIEVRRHVLGELNIGYCKGCMDCFTTKKCVQDDDMENVISDMMEADIVVIASPSYWGDITGQLKVFFNRSTPLSDTNGKTVVPKGKIGIAIAVRTGTREVENIHLVKAIEHYFGHLGIKPVKRLTVEKAQFKEDFLRNETKVNEAFEIGNNIVKYYNCD